MHTPKHPEFLKDAGVLISRLLIAAFFIPVGLKRIRDCQASVDYNASLGLPLPEAFTAVAIIVQAGVGTALLLGLQTRLCAAIFIICIAIWSVIYHGFWAMPEEVYARERISFFKNIALMGGMLMLAVHGPGRFSLDAWRQPEAPGHRNRSPARQRYARYY